MLVRRGTGSTNRNHSLPQLNREPLCKRIERYTTMKQFGILFIISQLTLGCGANFLEQIERIQPSTDSGYGYTPNAPIRIGYYDPQKSIGATYYFLSHLRGASGDSLELLGRSSLDDPNYKPPLLPSRFGGFDPVGILDCYILRPKGSTDTLALYFDIYNKGPINIPKGLTFVKEESHLQ